MGLFDRKKNHAHAKNPSALCALPGREGGGIDQAQGEEYALYRKLRVAVPVIDAALSKIVRLVGRFRVLSSDPRMQPRLDRFVNSVPVGIAGVSLASFVDRYLDSLLMYGNALGEILIDEERGAIAGLQTAMPDRIRLGGDRGGKQYTVIDRETGEEKRIAHPERILFTALTPPAGQERGVSILRGLPSLSGILLRIYECIGQNYDRIGNVRYAVSLKSGDGDAYDMPERMEAVAKQWAKGMRAGQYGEIRDFVCAGDVDIKVIGADNPLIDTEVPVRQILEELLAKLSIPPFLLGLNWSSTERMSSEQADILTSELEFYRRLIEPAIRQIGVTFLRLEGSAAEAAVEWEDINLQDATKMAQARLWVAQARKIEAEMGKA